MKAKYSYLAFNRHVFAYLFPNPPLFVQVFSVLESTYQHDSLRYLLDYFVPAKHLLHKLQQHACVSSKVQAHCIARTPTTLPNQKQNQLSHVRSIPWEMSQLHKSFGGKLSSGDVCVHARGKVAEQSV